MKRRSRRPGPNGRAALSVLAGLVILAAAAPGQQSVVDSVHNLSATGRGAVRAASEQEVCIFCHTPHRAAAARPLWNRQASLLPYTVYSSTALDAQPGQPTGSSKMCLSCHDGSIALGSVLSRDHVIGMAGAITTLPPGSPANLGSDLSDDHPISFRYDAMLAATDANLVNPLALPPDVRLDGRGELQCTTCHDAHDNTFGEFLVMDNTNSALCVSCHRISQTTIPAHQDCRSCHRPHSAPSGPFLLVGQSVGDTCLSCHDGSVPRAADIAADLRKLSVHDTGEGLEGFEVAAHGSCSDCHEPHTIMPGATLALGGAASEHELCFRCHGDAGVGGASGRWGRAGRTPLAARQIVQASTRLEFDPGNPSYHPVVAPGRNQDVPSLRAGWTEGSLVLCSDCHGSDSSRKAGGSGPDGVHGSTYAPILLARYETIDYTPESSSAYALCYRCHERDGFGGVLRDVSFPHRIHVVDARTPCSVCHDAHGISSAQGSSMNHSHLINFDTSIVFPDPLTGRLEFEDRGRFTGSCTLSCHGVAHSPKSY